MTRVVVVFVVCLFTLIPIRFDKFALKSAKANVEIYPEDKWHDYDNYTVIDKDTTWSGNVVYNNPNKAVALVDGATLTIKKGTRVELLEMYVFLGKIVAEGTADNKIVFTKATPDLSSYAEGYNNPDCLNIRSGVIEFNDSSPWYNMGPSVMRYVEFRDMGAYKFIDRHLCPSVQVMNTSWRDYFFPTALAQTASYPDVTHPAIMFRAGQLRIENSSFINNAYADVEVNSYVGSEDAPNYLNIINSNFSGNWQGIALSSNVIERTDENGNDIHDKNLVQLKNDFYGDSRGPKMDASNFTTGGIITGDYTLDSFRTNSLIVNPVIVIPGILGSMPWAGGVAGSLTLDPILHIYGNLIASLEKNGYVENKSLFEFPYEWRNSNVQTADELKNKIQEIKSQTGVSKVDVVAHSMGGLVARYYIEGANYQNDIDQLITLGTPQKGSPGAYLRWEAGEGFEGVFGEAARVVFAGEAHALGYNLKDYIQTRVRSVQELLPDYDYLYDVSKGEMRNYSNNYPQNTFLDYLNKDTNILNLKKVNFTNIVGKVSGQDKTIGRFRVVDSADWQHGMPENYNDPATYQGMEYVGGDETVPFSSASGIPSDEKIGLNSSHNDLPTTGQCYAIKKLTGKTTCYYVGTFERVTDMLTFGVFSPIDIQIVDPNGKRVGKDFTTGEILNEIDGAYYSGYKTDSEFLTIPNPIDGKYKILTQGTGSGSYRVEATKITEDPNNLQKAIESTQSIEGVATLNQKEEKTVEVKGTEVITEKKDVTPPTIAIAIPKTQDYLNNQNLKFDYAVTDDESGVDTQTITLDGTPVTDPQIDLSLVNLGAHKFKIVAKDKTGNASEKEIVFTITTSLDAIQDNIHHFADLKLIKNSQEEKFLLNQTKLLEIDQKLLAGLQKQKNPSWIAKILIKAFKSGFNHRIEVIVAHIEKSKLIESNAKILLLGSLNYLKS